MNAPPLHQIYPGWNALLNPFRNGNYSEALQGFLNFVAVVETTPELHMQLQPLHWANIYYNLAESAYGILSAHPAQKTLLNAAEWRLFFQYLDAYLTTVEQAQDSDERWWQAPNFPKTLFSHAITLLLNAEQAAEIALWTRRFLALWPEVTLNDVLFKAINDERIHLVRPTYLTNTQVLAQLYLELTAALPFESYRQPRSQVMNMLADLIYFAGGATAEQEALEWLKRALEVNPGDCFAQQRSRDIRERNAVMEQIRRFNHDANTAIAGLLATLQTLEQLTLPPPALKLVDKLQLGLQRIHGVHRSVQGQQADFKQVPLRPLVAQLVRGYTDLAHCQLHGGEDGAMLETDPDYFQIVLETLLHNAVEAFERQHIPLAARQIEIHLDPQRQRVMVSDNAGGIDPQLQERIFAPYVSSKAVKQMTGLGLANARVIMEKLLDGSLSLSDPQPRAGAAFTIQF